MKRSELLEIIREVLAEQEGGAVGNVTAALSGGEGSPKTPKAFAKKGAKTNAAIETAKNFGYTVAKRPKHGKGRHSDMFAFLDEMHYGTPHAFVSETEMEDSDAVKHTEQIGFKKTKASKKSDKK